MSRCVGMVSAAALLWAAVGCSLHSFLGFPETDHRNLVVAGSVAQVAATLETGLNDAGIHVVRKPLDGQVRLAGQAKSGKVFCLDVKREKTESGKKTAVTVRWGREVDDQLWQSVVDILTASPPETDDAPDPS